MKDHLIFQGSLIIHTLLDIFDLVTNGREELVKLHIYPSLIV